ncbi:MULTISPECIES: helix-turn-helix domain-containing protein [unclassified Lentimonas]|uniref:helix-turn-helix domain-containing protein n=1 Tax=unclassified Lentimonas TaxID=2630993 RepID=UPI001327DB04|nr:MULTISPECIES: helix-turn-helix domain-containing protein [unclassified Lentimonas]CAA6676657.1 Unannotated [Lentimonas sp. CC4]CAA6684679.1 Unannotated [Lentimonas sp. CC6]CAA7075314.1 Unannotated [Lentimonas sp. CC4]CAA7170996.1 Unannotated [Lentimonas sp. CC21]CAA7182277.1 Unannotated [Lentimonas sp. CC8]
MSWNYYNDDYRKPTVAELRAQAEKKIRTLKVSGLKPEPVPAGSRNGAIAKSFWGKAWCKNLEAYSDYEYRLPRGRSYVRNGAVVDLKIEPQKVFARVNGSELYELTVTIDPLAPEKWAALKAKCQGQIGSLIELLQGKFSKEIMSLVADKESGLFPAPGEIHFNCNCPDWADMCKHVAAALYGVGVRLDESPELLFKLRGVDHTELIVIDEAVSDLTKTGSSRRRRSLDNDALGDVFGIDLEDDPPAPRRPSKKAASKAKQPKPYSPTAAKVRKLRKQLGLSKAAFAREVGVTAPTISNWEKKTGVLKLKPDALEQLTRLHQAQ